MWLHFDAKYKVDWQRPFDTGDVGEEEDAERSGVSKRTDLLKMHAYRDAIRDSAGSYVLFPGSETTEFSLNDAEFLPGLGAFPLRPDRAENDVAALEGFISRALRHVAGAGTRHRRATLDGRRPTRKQARRPRLPSPPLASFLPPIPQCCLDMCDPMNSGRGSVRRACTTFGVATAPVRFSPTARISTHRCFLLYGRQSGELKFELYRRVGIWEGVTGEAIRRLGYPNPRGQAYLITSVRPLPSPAWLDTVDIHRLTPSGWLRGQPFSASWLDLVLSTQDR